MHSVDASGNFRGGYSQQNTKHKNKMLIFDAVRKSGKVSRVAVAGMTGLSTSTVSELTEELISEGFVVETGSEKTNARGRRPISLMLNADGAYSVIIEILNTGYNCYLCNLSCEIIDVYRFRAAADGDKKIWNVVLSLLSENGVKADKVAGMVFDYPGICDRENKQYIYSAVVDCSSFLSNDDICRLRSEFPGAHIVILNDSRIAAYASYMFTEDHFNEIVLFLNMYECIGAGAVFTNRKGEVVNTLSIEIGQTKQGYVGVNASRTFEKTAGALEVFRRVNAETDLEITYTEEYQTDVNFDCMRYLGIELERGNEKLMAVINDIARETALAISNTCKTLDSANIYIGGMFTGLGEYFRRRVADELAEVDTIPSPFERKIHIAGIDAKLKITGAANMLVDAVYAVPQ